MSTPYSQEPSGFVKKQRDHEPADFDNVRDEISHAGVQNTPESQSNGIIVPWANWWFRYQKFVPEDPSLEEAWNDAAINAVAIPEDRVQPGGQPELSTHEQQLIKQIDDRYVSPEPFERASKLTSLKPHCNHNWTV